MTSSTDRDEHLLGLAVLSGWRQRRAAEGAECVEQAHNNDDADLHSQAKAVSSMHGHVICSSTPIRSYPAVPRAGVIAGVPVHLAKGGGDA